MTRFWSMKLQRGDSLTCDKCEDMVIGHRDVHVYLHEAVRQDRAIGFVYCERCFITYVAEKVEVGVLNGTDLDIEMLEHTWLQIIDELGFYDLIHVMTSFTYKVSQKLALVLSGKERLK